MYYMIGLKNEAELLKKALGQKTFDLTVHPHELQVMMRMMINDDFVVMLMLMIILMINVIIIIIYLRKQLMGYIVINLKIIMIEKY